jgi:hypothetical protein
MDSYRSISVCCNPTATSALQVRNVKILTFSFAIGPIASRNDVVAGHMTSPVNLFPHTLTRVQSQKESIYFR